MSQVSEPYFQGISEDGTEWRNRADQHAVGHDVSDLNVTATLTRRIYGDGVEYSEELVPVVECKTCGAILRAVNQPKHDRLHGRTVYQR